MSAYETYTFQAELNKIDAGEKEMGEANRNLRGFILSKDFLADKPKFDDLTSQLESTLVTLAEEAEKPLPPLPAQSLPFSENEEHHQTTLEASTAVTKSVSYSTAAAVIIMYAVSGILAAELIISAAWFVAILACGLAMMLFDQIKNAVASLMQKKKEEETTMAMRLENWIVESFNLIREKYTSAFMLIKVQTGSKTTLPNYALPETDESTYNRRLYFETTLPTEFLTRIDRVIIACKKNVWGRKQVLINAIAVTKAAASGSKQP